MKLCNHISFNILHTFKSLTLNIKFQFWKQEKVAELGVVYMNGAELAQSIISSKTTQVEQNMQKHRHGESAIDPWITCLAI